MTQSYRDYGSYELCQPATNAKEGILKVGKFLTPEEVYLKKQRAKKVNLVLIGVAVLALFSIIPIVIYQM